MLHSFLLANGNKLERGVTANQRRASQEAEQRAGVKHRAGGCVCLCHRGHTLQFTTTATRLMCTLHHEWDFHINIPKVLLFSSNWLSGRPGCRGVMNTWRSHVSLGSHESKSVKLPVKEKPRLHWKKLVSGVTDLLLCHLKHCSHQQWNHFYWWVLLINKVY